jgi:hypothetical protein
MYNKIVLHGLASRINPIPSDQRLYITYQRKNDNRHKNYIFFSQEPIIGNRDAEPGLYKSPGADAEKLTSRLL